MTNTTAILTLALKELVLKCSTMFFSPNRSGTTPPKKKKKKERRNPTKSELFVVVEDLI